MCESERRRVCVCLRERGGERERGGTEVTLTKSGLKSLLDEAEGRSWRRRGRIR